VHIILSNQGLKKRYGEDFSGDTVDLVYGEMVELIASDRRLHDPQQSTQA
jgi:uncharacterized metal-binding protein